MALYMTSDPLSTRLALPLDLLQGALRKCNVTTGCLADLEAFAERLDSPGPLAEAVALLLRRSTTVGGLALNRMEMLDLLCIAVSGTDVQSAGPAMHRYLHRMLVFVNGVLLSMAKAAENPEPKELQRAESPEQEAQEAGNKVGTPDDFYVVERFELQPPASDGVPTAATTILPAPSRAVVWTTDLKQDARCPDRIVPQRPVPDASGEPVPLGEDHARAIAEESHPTEAEIYTAEGGDVGPPADLSAKRTRGLSQPALLACALVLGFGGGMLVPRFTPRGPNVATTPAALPVDTPPTPVAASGAYGPAALPQADGAPSGRPAQACAQAESAPPGTPIYTSDESNSGFTHSTALVSPSSRTLGAISPQLALAHMVYCPHPEYPALAKLTHVEGEVVLAIAISGDGSVVATRVLEGQPLLRGAAEAAVRHWQFRPFVEDGRAVPRQTLVVVDVRPPL